MSWYTGIIKRSHASPPPVNIAAVTSPLEQSLLVTLVANLLTDWFRCHIFMPTNIPLAYEPKLLATRLRSSFYEGRETCQFSWGKKENVEQTKFWKT